MVLLLVLCIVIVTSLSSPFPPLSAGEFTGAERGGGSWVGLVSNPFYWKGGTCGHHISCPRENIERRCEDKCLRIVLKSLSQLIPGFRENIRWWEFSLCTDTPMNDSYSNLKVLMIEQNMTAGVLYQYCLGPHRVSVHFMRVAELFQLLFGLHLFPMEGATTLGSTSTWGSSTFTGVPSPTFPTGFLHSACTEHLSTSFTWKAEISSVREHRM